MKKFRYALSQRLCIRCSNGINAKAELGIKKRSDRLKIYYANGGKHPTKGIGHSAASKAKMSMSHKGYRPMLSSEARLKLAEHCQRVLNNEKQKQITAEINKTRRGTLSSAYGKKPTHTIKVWYIRKSGDEVCFRSTWEAAFAVWLDMQSLSWEYEPKVFPVTYERRNIKVDGSYIPDFKVGSVWYEVKGRWTEDGLSKFRAFKAQYPHKRITVIDRFWLKAKGFFPKKQKMLSRTRRVRWDSLEWLT